MAKVFSISTKDLLHPGNNPTKRLDAEGAHALAVLGGQQSADTPARETIRILVKNNKRFAEWVKELRQKTRLEDVVNHITRALIGDRDPSRLSENVRKGIDEMAVRLCSEEKELIQKEIAADLKRIAQLEAILAS